MTQRLVVYSAVFKQFTSLSGAFKQTGDAKMNAFLFGVAVTFVSSQEHKD